MPDNDIIYIKKIKLSDGSVYHIKDNEALPKSGGTITGDLTVDNIITTNGLIVLSIETIATVPTNVLVQDSDGTIMKRSTDDLLSDIGGFSCSVEDSTGTLKLKEGK